MQVQYNSHSHPSSGNQHRSHTNGTNGDHSNTRPSLSTPTNGHLEEGDMYPHQYNLYAMGHGPPQQRQYQANQLPPMYGAGGAPPPMAPPPASAPGMSGQPSNGRGGMYPAQPQQQYQQEALGQTRSEGEPNFLSSSNGKYKFELKCEQQPQRARMCGFGDKDRRPVTPPPCVRLIVTDLRTGRNITPDDLEHTFYVLQVDLWDEAATREVNIVRSSTASPAHSISNASTTSFPPTVDRSSSTDHSQGMMHPGHHHGMYAPYPGYGPMAQGPVPGYPGYPPTMGGPGYYHQQHYAGMPGVPFQYAPPAPPPTQSHTMFTRNLIGSLTVNASALKDLDDQTGFWFVLQDLSVRMEGNFRLRMNFIDVGAMDGDGLNKTKAPVLAWIYSDPFQVFSAKKFPGVIESTDLSKKFATQGIKIPIRKDNSKTADGDDDAD
ncbi:uncharacterized protein LTR77_002060 [Saxophila tyrrhenica]|uniref:Velvet domain-containing protein n=1 Tax=Saxophila tyrrhenica TaxID=1690608 RepID=A0AAV9PIF3_9PEZI|nr:hypothetical protein LTR77_002060 [Saxophila tyrrhenica]